MTAERIRFDAERTMILARLTLATMQAKQASDAARAGSPPEAGKSEQDSSAAISAVSAPSRDAAARRRAHLLDRACYAGTRCCGVRASSAAAALATIVPSKNCGFCVPHRWTVFANVKSRKLSSVMQAFVDQLVGLRQRIAHVDHVEVADVRAVDRVQLRAERIALAEGRRRSSGRRPRSRSRTA
mgnify:CR=1 FL=1